MDKLYTILLDDLLIGTTQLERADPSMGVVFGIIHFVDIPNPYNFIRSYCQKGKIQFRDYPEDKAIYTSTLETLKVINDAGVEIKGLGNQIFGMEGNEFELTLEGIPYPFYGEEFPKHVKAEQDRFK